MASYAEILYEVRGPVDSRVARITLNRPDKRNPIGPTTIGELLHALDAAKNDAAVRVVVLTGAGKVFSAGGDLSTMGGGGKPLEAHGGAVTKPGTFVDLNLALVHLGKPTIAMVNGHALAGGLGVVVACDVAIAADDAQFGTPEINVGLWPMMIMATIFRNVTRKRGLELILTGDKISAADAAAMGLITRAVPRADLERAVDAIAEKLCGKSPAIVKMGLDAFHHSSDMELAPALEYLQGQLMAVLGTEDAREGLMAFLEKRAPVWKGR
jgi:enoyl-CoA hydratase/carnithine racemase